MIRKLCLLLALLMLLGLIAFRTADIPREVSCSGDIPAPASLTGVRIARALGGLVDRGSQPNFDATGEATRTTHGMWLVIGVWFKAFLAEARGEQMPPEVQQYETEYAKKQREHSDGCNRCQLTPSQSQDRELGVPQSPGFAQAPVSAAIGSHFGETGSWARYHTGLDYRAAYGTEVHAASDGVVTAAGVSHTSWAGNWVTIRHANGYSTAYAHLSAVSAQVGATVTKGQVIGKVGATGRAFGAHLHFEVYPPGVKPGDVYKAINPASWLAERQQQTGGKLTNQAVARDAAARYFPASELAMAVAIAGAESAYKPDATHHNRNGSTDYGLWQINSTHRSQPYWDDNWADPYVNAKMAYAIWQAAGNRWTPWSTYKSGSYRRFLAVSQLPNGQAVVPQPGGGGGTGGSLEGRGSPGGDGTAGGQAPQQEACSLPPDAATPGSYVAGGTRTITDPTSKITYHIPIPAGAAGKAINFALDQVGEPYKYGSQGPDSWDCSGLVSKAWATGGQAVYPQTETMVQQEHHVTGAKQPGDLLYKPGHVQMFLMSLPSGKDLVVEAPRTGLDVRIVAQWMTPTAVLRPDAGGGE